MDRKKLAPKLRFEGFEDDWDCNKLEDLCKITTGSLNANAMVEGGKYRFYTCAKDYFWIDNFAFDTEAILVSGNGANVGYIHRYSGKFNAYQRTYVLDDFDKDIVFIEYYLKCKLPSRIENLKKNGNTPYITKDVLTEMIIGLPAIKEQKRISTFLSKVDKSIELQSEEIKSAKDWKEGILQRMFV